eukprot:4941583-Pleurochrysis_carterae.AAC.1
MVPLATNSRNLKLRRWMCFDLAWLTGLWARLIAPELSMHSSAGPGFGNPNSVSQQATQVDCLACSKGACHDLGLIRGQRKGLLLFHAPGYRNVGQHNCNERWSLPQTTQHYHHQ